MADGCHGERSLWNLSTDEKRMLLITFAGGVASIVASAAIIGLAIAFARWWSKDIGLSRVAGLTVFEVLAGIVVWYYMRRYRRRRLPRRVAYSLVTLVFTWTVLILTWVGLAAGIH